MLNNTGVYIYQLQLDKSKFYIGSSFDILNRVAQHRNSFSKKINTCPKFYNCVRKHGWNSFKFGVLEGIIKSVVIHSKRTDNVLIEKEQFYLDKLSPTLNINKIARSRLGYKHSEKIRKTMSAKHRGINTNKSKVKLSYNISEKTKNNVQEMV
jgi:group I intron endonuclease